MKLAIIVVGMVALAVLFAGCTSQGSNVNSVTNTAAPVYTDTPVSGSGGASLQFDASTAAPVYVDNVSTQTPIYHDNPVVKLEGNKSYQLTGAEVQGCKIAAYIDNNGTTEMRNAPDNPPECQVNGVGRG